NPIRSTSPLNPASETSRLLPPPSTKSGSARSLAQGTASTISSSLAAWTNQRAGPPMPKVVKGASGLFSSRSTDQGYTTGFAVRMVAGNFPLPEANNVSRVDGHSHARGADARRDSRYPHCPGRGRGAGTAGHGPVGGELD